MKERVLITGASGFLGYHLIEASLNQGFEVSAGIRKSSQINHLKKFPIEFDSTNYMHPNEALDQLKNKRYDYIIHAAGIVKAKNTVDFEKVNLGLTQVLAQSVKKANISLKKFVFISSLSALGPLEKSGLINEQKKPKPLTFYGKSKLKAEAFLRTQDIPLLIFRPTAIYGPMEKELFLLTKSIARGIEPYIGKNPQILSFIYVKDLARLVVKSLTSDKVHKTYNVSDGKPYTRYDFANIIKNTLNHKTLKLHLPVNLIHPVIASIQFFQKMGFPGKAQMLTKDKLAEIMAYNWSVNNELVGKELDFIPEYSLEKGLNETLQWYQNNQWI